MDKKGQKREKTGVTKHTVKIKVIVFLIMRYFLLVSEYCTSCVPWCVHGVQRTGVMINYWEKISKQNNNYEVYRITENIFSL